MQPNKVAFANTLRGFAALCVLVFHYFFVFWALPDGVAHLINAPALSMAISSFVSYLQPDGSVFSLGPFGVALFFLISGFVIPFSLREATLTGFLGNRLLRIMPTYAAGFTISLCAVWICSRYFGAVWPFAGSHVLAHYFPGIRDVLNYPMIDGIIWTLDVEMKFYALCAITIAGFRTKSFNILFLPLALFVVSMAGWAWLHEHARWFDQVTVHWYHLAVNLILSSQFIVFMFIGVAFHYLHSGRINRNSAFSFIACFFLLFLVMLKSGPDKAGSDLMLSYVWALLLFSAAFFFQPFFEGNRLTDFFAEISYPLYVSHGLAGYVTMRILLAAGTHPVIALLLATAGAILMAWALHQLIELPSQALAKAIAQHGKRKRISS